MTTFFLVNIVIIPLSFFTPSLKRERYGKGPEILFVLLGFKFLRPVNIGIGDFEAVDDHPDAADQIGDERFFVHAVALLEGVPVEEDVPGYGVPINGKEERLPAFLTHLPPAPCKA
jgi:hypothetical protein